MINDILYNTDPIFWWDQDSTVTLYLGGLRAQQITREVRVTRPELELKCSWIDGLNHYANLDNQLLITNIVAKNIPDQVQSHIHSVNPSFYGMYFCNYKYSDIAPSRGFSCFMSRMDSFRQSWLFQLIRQNLLHQGNVSFNLKKLCDSDLDISLALKEFDLYFQNNNQIFENEYHYIRPLLPFKNFVDQGGLVDPIMDSKYNIVIETIFHDNTTLAFTEKTFRNLQLPRPWLLFAAAYSVEQLRSWGFDVLDDCVDHSYDHLLSEVDRQTAIIDQVNYLIKQPWTQGLAQRCQRAVANNQRILKAWHDQWQINIEADFQTAKQILLNF